MNVKQSQMISTKLQQIEQILVYSRTFRNHNIILSGKRQVSPYQLACNGFVNKYFKEEEKQLNLNQHQIRQVTCVCRSPQCSKTLKFNDKIQGQNNEEQIQTYLTEHQENCAFYGKQFKRLSLFQLFQSSNMLFDEIYESYLKDDKRMCQKLKINQSFIDKIFFSQQKKLRFNVQLECYKQLDNKFCIQQKKFQNSKLLSLFGWKFHSFNQNNLISLKCHFCGKKVQKQIDTDKFDPLDEHNIWCLTRSKEYEIWKLMLKKKYEIRQKQKNIRLRETQNLKFLIPKTEQQIKSKLIREELFQVAKPALQKIDQLLERSLQFVKKQRHLSDNQYEKRVQEGKYSQNKIQYLRVFQNLDEISKKCQSIIKDFINSIQTKKY